MHYLLVLFTLFYSAHPIASERPQSIAGVWSGEAQTEDETTRLTLTIEEDNIQAGNNRLTARMSLLDIGVSGWPAMSVQFNGDQLEILFPSDSGPQKMTLQPEGQRLVGTWSDKPGADPARITLVLKTRGTNTGYDEKPVLIPGTEGNLGASLILPKGEGPFPGVVFLHGSGPQPRDANRFAAERFASMGVASLIYDKRGVGNSEGHYFQAGFEDLAADAVSVAGYLQSMPQVSRVGFWGHSQGGWIAPLAATLWPDTNFVITSAGPAVSPAHEGEWGFVHAIRQRPDAAQVTPLVRDIVAAWHQGIRSEDWTLFKQLKTAHKKEPWFQQAGLATLSEHPDKNFLAHYRLFMDYQPLPTLTKLKVPMLAIFAPDDESIDARESMELVAGLRGSGVDIRLLIYPGYSHSMRRNAKDKSLRFPNHPDDYFQQQVDFIHSSANPTKID